MPGEKKYLRPAVVRSLARLGPPEPQARKDYGPSEPEPLQFFPHFLDFGIWV